MRLIGKLESEKLARRFSEYILSCGIVTRVDQNEDDWLIWVVEEDRVPQAREELDSFRQNPDVSKYDEGVKLGRKIQGEMLKAQKQYEQNQINVRQQWEPPQLSQSPVSMGLIVLCIVVAFMTSDGLNIGGKNNALMSKLMIVPVDFQQDLFINDITKPLSDGEVWRYITPMLLHFGVLHIVFNLMWVKDLGPVIESKIGSFRFLFLVLFIAIVSNVAQFVFTEFPKFGGMSGVVFGLIGFIWIRGKLDPKSGFFMPKQLLVFLFVFQMLCFSGVIGNIANYAHAVGFIAGMFAGASVPMVRRLLGQ